MKIPLLPHDEEKRLHVLESLDIIYSPAEERFDRITRLACKLFDVPIVLISLVTGKSQWFKSAQGLPVSETPKEISFCGHAILHEDTFVVPDALLDQDFADNPLVTGDPFIRFYAGHPLNCEGRKIGTFCIIDREPRQLSPSDLETLRSLAGWVENELNVTALSEAQIRLLSERDEARREAMVDPLTKVWNRRGIDELLSRELSLAKRERSRVFMMLIDVDYFKEINDRYGHVAGDLALKKVAQRIRSSLRPYDVIGRFGGDEFLVFAVGCSDETGMLLARRILERVSSEAITDGKQSFSVSLTIGASSATATADFRIDKLIETADAALYDAKTAGRNCARYRALTKAGIQRVIVN